MLNGVPSTSARKGANEGPISVIAPPPPQIIRPPQPPFQSGTVPGEAEPRLLEIPSERLSADTDNGGVSGAESASSDSSVIICETVSGTQAIDMNSVISIRSQDKAVLLKKADADEEIHLLQTMKEMEKRIAAMPHLVRYFVRCHHSLIVNLDFCPIQNPKGKDSSVCLVYGGKQEWQTVSRTYKSEFLRKWYDFYGR